MSTRERASRIQFLPLSERQWRCCQAGGLLYEQVVQAQLFQPQRRVRPPYSPSCCTVPSSVSVRVRLGSARSPFTVQYVPILGRICRATASESESSDEEGEACEEPEDTARKQEQSPYKSAETFPAPKSGAAASSLLSRPTPVGSC